jgi:hypothetical protein
MTRLRELKYREVIERPGKIGLSVDEFMRL